MNKYTQPSTILIKTPEVFANLHFIVGIKSVRKLMVLNLKNIHLEHFILVFQ